MSARKLFNGLVILALLLQASLAGRPTPVRAAEEPKPLSTDVCGPITSDTTWTLANSPYVVTCDVTVQAGVTLTIEPGVVVKFQDYWDNLVVNGRLMAQGTGAQSIVFTSLKDDAHGGDSNGDGSASSPAPDDWGSLRFTSSSTGSVLDHAVVRYGGGWYNQNIWVDTTDIALTNSTIASAGGYGLYFDNVLPPTLSNNTFISNTNYAAYAGLDDNADSIALSGNTATGNGVNGFGVAGSITRTVTWDGDDTLPFVADNDLTVNEGATLTLTPGTVVKFEDYWVNLWVKGTLMADTTADAPITFTSFKDDSVGGDTNGDGSASSPAPDNWGSLRFTSSSTGSVLDHTVVRYGGYWYDQNVWVDSTDITLTNNTIAFAGGYGLYFDNALPPSLSHNTFISNTNYAAYAALASNADSIALSGNTATGNGVN
nr:right-handed parallel beta-helix repeat-containing protein [Anaerolineales bacterium]